MVTYSRSRRNIRRAAPRRRRAAARRRAPSRRRRQTTPRRGRGQSCVCPGELTPSAKFIMAQLDPFESMVLGAKVPDSNTIPSIATADTDQPDLLGGTASQTLAMAFRPQYTWGTIQATPNVGSVSWGAAYATNAVDRSKKANYVAAIELTRPVAHAIRLSSQLSPTTASGFVHICLSTETNLNVSTWQYPTTVSQMSSSQYYKRVTLASLTQSPLTVINKWLDDTGFRYSSPNADLGSAGGVTFQSDYGWAAIVVMVTGAPATLSPITFEHLLLSEGIPNKDGVIIGTQAASNSPGIMSAAADVSSNLEPFHTEAEQDTYVAQGLNAVAQGAAAAGDVVFQNVAMPLLRRAGYAATGTAARMAMNAVMGMGGIPGVNSNSQRLAIN